MILLMTEILHQLRLVVYPVFIPLFICFIIKSQVVRAEYLNHLPVVSLMNHDQDQAPEWEDFDGRGPTQIGGAG